MTRLTNNTDSKTDHPPVTGVPPGAPRWVTPELIEQTLRVWQPYYSVHLLPEDALEIITNVAQFVDVLTRGDDHETVRRAGTCEQS